ncbi:hypothetical protein BMUNKI379_21720 [Burkholderia multivorans]|nr:hypothetical protein BMUNKI379_21720 [Burkholderia multivorans]
MVTSILLVPHGHEKDGVECLGSSEGHQRMLQLPTYALPNEDLVDLVIKVVRGAPISLNVSSKCPQSKMLYRQTYRR